MARRRAGSKNNKMIPIVGAALMLAIAAVGSQMFVEGRVYLEKIQQLESRGYELNGTMPWSEIDAWEEHVREMCRYRINVVCKEVASWDEFYTLIRWPPTGRSTTEAYTTRFTTAMRRTSTGSASYSSGIARKGP